MINAKAYAGADITDYKVNVNQIAKKASTVIRSDSSEIQAINNYGKGIIAVKMTDTNGKILNAACNVVMDNGEVDMNATIKSLNSELKKNGLNVSAKYSEFSKGIVLESDTTGEQGSFDLSIKENDSIENHNQQGQEKLNEYLNTLTYEHYAGQNAKGMITKGNDTIPIDSQTNSVLIDNVEFSFKGITVTKTSADDASLVSSIEDLSESGTNGKNVTIKKESHDGKVTLTIQNDDSGNKKSETIERKFGNITVKTNTEVSTGAQTTIIHTKDSAGNDILEKDTTKLDDSNGSTTEKVEKTKVSGDNSIVDLNESDSGVNITSVDGKK